jgi:hypothetical protein
MLEHCLESKRRYHVLKIGVAEAPNTFDKDSILASCEKKGWRYSELVVPAKYTETEDFQLLDQRQIITLAFTLKAISWSGGGQGEGGLRRRERGRVGERKFSMLMLMGSWARMGIGSAPGKGTSRLYICGCRPEIRPCADRRRGFAAADDTRDVRLRS